MHVPEGATPKDGPSAGVAMVTSIVSVLTGIIFGLLPAIRMSRTDISVRLKDSGRAISGPRTRMQSALVMGEMAMALVLLVGAGLMCRTLVQLWKVDPGFDPRNVLTMRVVLTGPAYSTPDKRNRFYTAKREALGPMAEMLERLWDDALWKLKLAAELEQGRRGPKPRRPKEKQKKKEKVRHL